MAMTEHSNRLPQESLTWISAVFLGLLALLVYANSFPGVFIADDLPLVKENPLVASLDLRSIFTTDYWGIDSNSGLFRPLTILSLAMNRVLFGNEAWGFHLVNVFLHALCVFLLYAVAARFIPRSLALLAAVLFAVHPLHTEVVNEIVGRSELLVAAFILTAVWVHMVASRAALPLTALCYLLALWSKEHAIVLPALLLVLDYYRDSTLRQTICRRWKSYVLLSAVAIFWLIERVSGVQRGGVPADAPDPVLLPLHFLTPVVRILTALKLQLIYLGKELVPFRLHGHYGGTFAEPLQSPASLWFVLVVILIPAGLWYLLRGIRSRQLSAYFVLCYLVSVLPTANLLFPIGVTFAERLAFLPSVWFCCALVSFGDEVVSGQRQHKRVVVLLLIVAALWSVRTVLRNADFRDPVRLWSADVAQQPENAVAWMFLGDAQESAGQREAAATSFRKVVELAPNYPQGLARYAEFLLNRGDAEEAIIFGERALHAQPGVTFPPAHLTIACAAVQWQRYGLALEHLRALHGRFSGFGAYWECLGSALSGNGDRLGALEAFERERSVYFPPESDVQIRMANLLLQLGRSHQAERLLRDELERRNSAAGWNALGVVLIQQQRQPEAIAAFRQAVALAGDNPNYQRNLQRANEE